MRPAFAQTEHRPWPLPGKPWIMKQVWHDLLFAHWSVSPEAILADIPQGLELDTFDGQAWLGVVPFYMSGVTPRGCPAIHRLCDFPELNLRTYVRRGGKPGVWFYSLDVTNGFAAWIARRFFHLPYQKAQMQVQRQGPWVEYHSWCGGRELVARYRGLPEKVSREDTFAHWCTERYCLYCSDEKGGLYRGEIQHPEWPLQKAEWKVSKNTFLNRFPLSQVEPVLHFSSRLDVVVYPLEYLAPGDA